ncbi:MAG: UDP-N-acetylglucosamine--N-acetylmuramyl-(pentapeptide) pyrophosphoryl-undecaprenol N-acetylglucosamine transferase [Planctomycetes bacterium]|nr:UDP-N-acetylglucosamine--N-acetylmuramyl-(pentapeptide) pyrophosphoryl-undecaprenol N-acetylglucosamine transferase [Planctomycetota bacterium]
MQRARAELGFDPDRPLLVVLGGSQGAAGLNRFVQRHAAQIAGGGVQLLHQTGPGRAAEGAPELPGCRTVEYIDPMHTALCAATLALSRGGASTLAEIAALRLPALVVPYPHHADRHQERNARVLGEGLRLVDRGPQASYEQTAARARAAALRRGRSRRARASGAALAAIARPSCIPHDPPPLGNPPGSARAPRRNSKPAPTRRTHASSPTLDERPRGERERSPRRREQHTDRDSSADRRTAARLSRRRPGPAARAPRAPAGRRRRGRQRRGAAPARARPRGLRPRPCGFALRARLAQCWGSDRARREPRGTAAAGRRTRRALGRDSAQGSAGASRRCAAACRS